MFNPLYRAKPVEKYALWVNPVALIAYPNISGPGYRAMLALCLLFTAIAGSADVVKPALTEILVQADGRITVEIRTSLEALLSGIDGSYRNTQDAPTADLYDQFRVLPAGELEKAFQGFHQTLIDGVNLTIEQKTVALDMESIDIPEPGYTKVPRTSVIRLQGQFSGSPQYLQWYYPSKFGDHAVRVKLVDESRDYWYWSEYQWIREDRISDPFQLGTLVAKSAWYSVLYTYLEAGFLHILPWGADHVLFVIGLLLMSLTLRPLIWQVTMFTLAHSITLSLSTLGLFSLSASLVEPLIALSIAYIAIENIFQRQVKPSRLAIIFGFGLLHGLGFAAMLVEFGLPEGRYLLALLGFNLGVEAGQVVVVLIVWFGVVIWFRRSSWYRRIIVVPASALIALVGLFWFWQRLDWAEILVLV